GARPPRPAPGRAPPRLHRRQGGGERAPPPKAIAREEKSAQTPAVLRAEWSRGPVRTPRRTHRALAFPPGPTYSASALPLSAGVYLPRPALHPLERAFSDISAAARPMMRPGHRHLKLLQRFQPPRLALTWEQPRLHGRLAKDQNGASREGRRWISASLGSARWASPWPA